MENRSSAPVMSMGDWIITMIVLAIPLVGFIMMFVWGFSSTTNPNKANYCKAALVFVLISVVLVFVLMMFGGLAALSSMSGAGSGGM
jgi:uncharacterized membrane protein YdbT with pleckstrin-like domain